MKRAIIAILVVLSLVISSTAALAAPPTPPAPKAERQGPPAKPGTASLDKRHGVAGAVQNVGTNGFDVVAKQGTIHVVTNGSTRFDVKGKPKATLADVANGSRVNVQGTPQDGGLLAKRVHVIPGKPSIEHAVGEVTAYSAANGSTAGSITVKDRWGASHTLAVTDKTKIEFPDGVSAIQVGDRVTVVANKDATPTARAIVVQPKRG